MLKSFNVRFIRFEILDNNCDHLDVKGDLHFFKKKTTFFDNRRIVCFSANLHSKLTNFKTKTKTSYVNVGLDLAQTHNLQCQV